MTVLTAISVARSIRRISNFSISFFCSSAVVALVNIIFFSISSMASLVGVRILTLILCSDTDSCFNNWIIPNLYSRRNALVVGSINRISCLADFTKSMNNSCILNGPKITSVLPKVTPSSISLIFCSEGIDLLQKLSKTYCCCSMTSLILL